MLDIVYPVRPGQRNEELRYSLRSLSNLPHGRVWVVGYQLPDWLRNVGIIPTEPQLRSRYRDTEAKLLAALQHSEVSDPFYLFNDDMFVLRKVRSVKVHHLGPLKDRLRGRILSAYGKGIASALARLEGMGIENPLSYELHVPFRIQRQRMVDVLSLRDGIDSYHYRTMYGNIYQIRGSYSDDVKVYRHSAWLPEQEEATYLSTSDMTFRYHKAGTYIQSRFQDPSPYEYQK